jgi:hypothetical protein
LSVAVPEESGQEWSTAMEPFARKSSGLKAPQWEH